MFGGKKRFITGALALTASLLVLSACGSEGSTPNGQTSADEGPVQEIRVEMGDFFYNPGEITAEAGKVRFILANVGATAHRFSITGGEVKASSKNVGAGRESSLEVELPPGTYKLGCTLGDHEARGSVGTLTVR